KKNGFKVVDATENGYELLALSFDGTKPHFPDKVKKATIESEKLTIYYSMQCPFIYQTIETIEQYCEKENIPFSLLKVDNQQKAKDLPCVFNNWALFYKRNFETVNLLDIQQLTRILQK